MNIIITLFIVLFSILNANATDLPAHVNFVTYAIGNPYTSGEKTTLEAYYNTFVFNRAATQTDRNAISSSKYRGIYSTFISIQTNELGTLGSYRAEVPGSPGTYYYNATFDNYLARFWDTDWLAVRLANVPDVSTADFVFLDEINLKAPQWLTNLGYALPTQVDTVPEWRQAELDAISYFRTGITSTIEFAVNSIHFNGANPIYNGQDTVSPGTYGDVSIFEGFISDANSYTTQNNHLAIATQVIATPKKCIVLCKPTTTTSIVRGDCLAKYLLIGDGTYSEYTVKLGTAWSPYPSAFATENFVNYGSPSEGINADITAGTPAAQLYTRAWDAGHIGIVNFSNNFIDLPAQYNSYKIFRISTATEINNDGSISGRTLLSSRTNITRSYVTRDNTLMSIAPNTGIVLVQ